MSHCHKCTPFYHSFLMKWAQSLAAAQRRWQWILPQTSAKPTLVLLFCCVSGRLNYLSHCGSQLGVSAVRHQHNTTTNACGAVMFTMSNLVWMQLNSVLRQNEKKWPNSLTYKPCKGQTRSSSAIVTMATLYRSDYKTLKCQTQPRWQWINSKTKIDRGCCTQRQRAERVQLHLLSGFHFKKHAMKRARWRKIHHRIKKSLGRP